MQSLPIEPASVRGPGTLQLRPIEINRYATPFAAERTRRGDPALVSVLRNMVLIREVETMLNGIKREGTYGGISYTYRGPAHLSVGQEAAAAGQALALTLDDHTFGSHRSHGEILARGMAGIDAAGEHELERIMAAYPETAAVVERCLPFSDVRTKARSFLVYGLIAEIFGRSTGFNKGVGGSMHAFLMPLGIYPNNAIVGGSATIAAGAALFKCLQSRPGVAVANIGDGSSACGPVWEAMNFSAMAQFRTLLDDDHREGLPVIFFFMNNFYAMGGQTIGETMGFEHVSRIGAGVNAENMHAETIDGMNPLAVADAVERAKEHIAGGTGPALIDCQCYRFSGHSSSDASTYRTREEVELWRAVDPVPRFRELLVDENVVTAATASKLDDWASELVAEATRAAVDHELSPSLSVDEIEGLTFSNHLDDARSAPPGELLVAPQEIRRLAELSHRPRAAAASDGGPVQLRDALYEAIVERLVADDRLVVYGEENRDWGGAFGVYRGLTEMLPYRRLFNAPISEAAIVGSAVGYAMEGGRALVELMYADFMGRAGDELFNQLPKWIAMSGGRLRLPVVVRVSVGSAYGPQHSQDWTGLVAHIPGLKVVYPVTPYDAKGLMTAALAQDDPVIFFESQKLYPVTEYLRPGGVPAGHVYVPIGAPRIVRDGHDVTLLTVGPTLYRALEAASELSRRYGIEAEVIDARTVTPLDLQPVVESVRRTKRLLLASDATQRGSVLNTFATEIQRAAFDDLDAPVVVIGSYDCVTPPADLEDDFFPSARRILDELHCSVVRLPGYDSPGAAISPSPGRR
jgi:2-oxoisovalerate dehydrogenase E1 component